MPSDPTAIYKNISGWLARQNISSVRNSFILTRTPRFLTRLCSSVFDHAFKEISLLIRMVAFLCIAAEGASRIQKWWYLGCLCSQYVMFEMVTFNFRIAAFPFSIKLWYIVWTTSLIPPAMDRPYRQVRTLPLFAYIGSS